MKKPWLLIAGIALLGVGAIVLVNSNSKTPTPPAHNHQLAQTPVQSAAPTAQTSSSAMQVPNRTA